MKPVPTAPRSPWRRHGRWLAVVAFVALAWAVVEASGLRGQLSLAAVREGFTRHLGWGVTAFVGLFVVANLIHVPGGFFLVAGVLALGPVWGAVLTYVSACLACTVTFLVVRTLGADALRQLPGPLARRLLGRLDRQPLRSVVLLRLIFHSVPALNYALALSGVSARHYIGGTLLGLPLPILVVTWLLEGTARWLGLT